MKEMENTPKDALTDGITDAVRDIAKKRETMEGWEQEYSRKSGLTRIMVISLASAACVALGVILFWRNPSETLRKEPVLRGALSYDAVLEKIDSLIQVGDMAGASERITETRKAIAEDTMEIFHPAAPTTSDDEIEYSRIIIKDVLSRLDELETKILKTNE
ncbi:MAG TPA: hypothetical protein DDX40_10755 [Rikenellaceae bacterium]|nr:hypothetical protein [Rikenellaceae bacterium]